MTEKLTFTGIVQGIGFRPACRRIAIELGVNGRVKNSCGNVCTERVFILRHLTS